MSEPWLHVIGIGEEGLAALAPELRARVAEAEFVFGGERHLALIGNTAARKFAWATPLSRSMAALRACRPHPTVVLATGDPWHFGIGVTLAREFSPAEMRIHPAVSAFSLAAARLFWPIAETECLTIHGRSLALLIPALAPERKLLILAHDGASPAKVAAFLTERGYGESRMTILEHMGGASERIRIARARDFDLGPIADLNTIAILCRAEAGRDLPPPRVFGLADSLFRHDGQLTKRELRSAALSALAPSPGERLWDIGAGSGAIAIEWLRHHSSLQAIAIEHRADRCAAIRANAEALGVPHLDIRDGEAPQILADLPPPQAIFIGGGASRENLIAACWDRLASGGRMVAHGVSAEAETALFAAFRRHGGEMTRIGVERLHPLGAYHGWKPLMPVTQWRAVKP